MLRLAYCISLAVFLASGCGGSLDDFNRDAGADADADTDAQAADAAQGPFFIVKVEGDLTPRTINDGLSGQTPSEYVMWVGRFELLRSPSDTNPVLVFDNGTDYGQADMLTGTHEVGRGLARDVPRDTYTHVRVTIIAVRVTIEGNLHFMGSTTPGDMTIFGALSDCTIDQVSYTQGDARYTFNSQTVPGLLPALPSSPVGTIGQWDGKTWLTAVMPEPLVIDGPVQQDQSVTVVFDVNECFRWQDEQLTDYIDGEFDFTPSDYEQVVTFGATGYRVELR